MLRRARDCHRPGRIVIIGDIVIGLTEVVVQPKTVGDSVEGANVASPGADKEFSMRELTRVSFDNAVNNEPAQYLPLRTTCLLR